VQDSIAILNQLKFLKAMKRLAKIVVNGREYDGIEQMPPDVRQQYLQLVSALGDANGNGVPDILELPGSSNAVVKESILYNGREYKDRSELPAEARELLEQMPEPEAGDAESRLEIKTTKVFPTQVTVSERWAADNQREPAGVRSAFPRLLVTGLIAAVLFLLFLWLSGIKPEDLWRR